MKNYISGENWNKWLFNNSSISHFAKANNISKSDQQEIRVAYQSYTMWLSIILAFLITVTMIFDYVYGFYSNYFFNEAGFGIYKFIGVTLDFVMGSLYITYFFSTNKKDISCTKREIIQIIYYLSVIIGSFLFFISDAKDPATSSSFSIPFIWVALLAIVPLYSVYLWSGLGVVALSLTITFVTVFGSTQTTTYQYYIIMCFSIAISFIMRMIHYKSSYYRFLDSKNSTFNELMSETDPLTHAENRRGMEKFFSIKMPGWLMNGSYVTLAIIDIDGFKNYNDLFGHVKGDECLIRVTNAIVRSFPNLSLDIFRFGGDEFIVVIEEPNLLIVEKYIKAILNSVKNEKIPITNEPNGPILTISIGAKTLKIDENYSLTNHVDLADKLLYKVKNEGRNHAMLNNEIIFNKK